MTTVRGEEQKESPPTLIRPTAVAMAVDTVGVLPVFLTGALAVQLRDDIGLSVNSLGLVYASYFTAAALLSAALAHVSERTGPEWSLRIGSAIYVGAFLGIASIVESPVALSAFIGLTVIVLIAIPSPSGRWVAKRDDGRADMSRGMLIFAAISFGLGSSAAASL